MHSAELIEIDYFFVFADAWQFDERSIDFDLLLVVRLRATTGEDVLYMFGRNDFLDFKAAVIQSSEYFCFGEDAPFALGQVVIEPAEQEQSRQEPPPDEPSYINKVVNTLWIGSEDFLLDVLLGAVAADVSPVVGQFLVDDTESSVNPFKFVEQDEIDECIVLVIGYFDE